jgi:nucleoside-diphosphate-sugar epimerase
MRCLVPGGCGYIGAMLVGWLLVDGHHVTVYDTQWFGTGHLPDNPNLTVIKGDVRDRLAFGKACRDQEAVIYLASISNNDLCVREPALAFEVNYLAFLPAVRAARLAGVGALHLCVVGRRLWQHERRCDGIQPTRRRHAIRHG